MIAATVATTAVLTMAIGDIVRIHVIRQDRGHDRVRDDAPPTNTIDIIGILVHTARVVRAVSVAIDDTRNGIRITNHQDIVIDRETDRVIVPEIILGIVRVQNHDQNPEIGDDQNVAVIRQIAT